MIASKDDHAHFPFLYKYVTLPSKRWSLFLNPWILTGPMSILTKRVKKNWFSGIPEPRISFLLELSCQCYEAKLYGKTTMRGTKVLWSIGPAELPDKSTPTATNCEWVILEAST